MSAIPVIPRVRNIDPNGPAGVATLWKCRLCGAVVSGPATMTTEVGELSARIHGPTKADRISMHECRSGAWGVTDLVGATEVPGG